MLAIAQHDCGLALQAPDVRPGLQRTRKEDRPPVARKGQPVHGPTVWYGANLTPADVEFRRARRARSGIAPVVRR